MAGPESGIYDNKSQILTPDATPNIQPKPKYKPNPNLTIRLTVQPTTHLKALPLVKPTEHHASPVNNALIISKHLDKLFNNDVRKRIYNKQRTLAKDEAFAIIRQMRVRWARKKILPVRMQMINTIIAVFSRHYVVTDKKMPHALMTYINNCIMNVWDFVVKYNKPITHLKFMHGVLYYMLSENGLVDVPSSVVLIKPVPKLIPFMLRSTMMHDEFGIRPHIQTKGAQFLEGIIFNIITKQIPQNCDVDKRREFALSLSLKLNP